MEGLRFPELIIIFVLVALLFGPQKIAGIGTGLGKAIRDFRSAMSSKDEDVRAAAPAPQALPPAKDPVEGTVAAAGGARPPEPAAADGQPAAPPASGGEREPKAGA